MKSRIVQKYGGTLLCERSDRRLVVESVREAWAAGSQVVVVVSAMGRAGDPYATDTLIGLARQVGQEPEPRALDCLLNAGEAISASLLSMELNAAGVPSIPYTGAAAGVVTTSDFGRAAIVRVDASRLEAACRDGTVPVVAGFQGVTEKLEPTTLGRGGSDLTAVALGSALDARVVEIVKDVDGVMSADPTIVPDARPLPEITYEDLLNVTSTGSRVVQREAVSLAAEHRVSLVVRKLGADGGTRVSDTRTSIPVLTCRDGMVTITGLDERRAGQVLASGSERLRAAGIPLLRAHHSARCVAFVVEPERAPHAAAHLERLARMDSSAGTGVRDGPADAQPE